MKPIRIAIIGFGKIAADQHVPSIAGNPRFELVATSSRSGQGVGTGLHRLAQLIREVDGPRGGGDHDAAGAALRNRARLHRRRAPRAAGKAADRDACARSTTSPASPKPGA